MPPMFKFVVFVELLVFDLLFRGLIELVFVLIKCDSKHASIVRFPVVEIYVVRIL